MSHIVIDARVINSGTGDYVKYLLINLEKIDQKNTYTVLVPSKDLAYWQPTKKNFVLKAADFPNYSFAEQLGFRSFLESLSPDLVHFCMPQQPLLYRGKRVTTFHDMTLLRTYNSDKNWLIFHMKQLVGRFVWRYISHVNQHIIAITENTKREYQDFSHIPEEKISVIYEASAAQEDTPLVPYTNASFPRFIMYAGQHPDYKNIRRLAEAHQKLLSQYPDLGLILVGRLNPDTLANKKFFEDMGYKNIHFTGYVSEEQRDWLFSKAAAYVFPSLMEGFGLPPLIAMTHGTPVVSSNASCMPEVLGDAAHYFNPLDVNDMAAKISEVLNNKKLRDALVKKGRRQVKKYSWEKAAKQTLAIYERVLKSPQ